MNGVMAGIVISILILIGGVVLVTGLNNLGASQQSSAQTYTSQQITSAESAAAGTMP